MPSRVPDAAVPRLSAGDSPPFSDSRRTTPGAATPIKPGIEELCYKRLGFTKVVTTVAVVACRHVSCGGAVGGDTGRVAFGTPQADGVVSHS